MQYVAKDPNKFTTKQGCLVERRFVDMLNGEVHEIITLSVPKEPVSMRHAKS